LFCDEPIIAVYTGEREYHDLVGANAFFDCYHELAYHVTEGHRMVLETEHYYLSLGADGILKDKKTRAINDYAHEGEWLEPCIHNDVEPPWIDYESTLLVGERLLQVTEKDGHSLLRFDDFELKVVPHRLGDRSFPSLRNKDHWSYHHVLGAERLITRKCACGGEGTLLLDFVADYVVRCKKCKKSTWAAMNAQVAIEEWNSGQVECDLSDIKIE